MADAVVKFDRYRWTDEDGTVHEADKGETIAVSADEFERGEAMGALEAAGKSGDSSDEPLPRTQKGLDELAVERGVEFPEDVSTVKEKQAFLGGDAAASETTPGMARREDLEALSRDELVAHAEGVGVENAGDYADTDLIAAIQAAGALAPPPPQT